MNRIEEIIRTGEKSDPPINAKLGRVHETFVKLYGMVLEHSSKETLQDQERTLLFAVRVTKFYLHVKKRHPEASSRPDILKDQLSMASQAMEIADAAKKKLLKLYEENRNNSQNPPDIPPINQTENIPNKPPPAYPDLLNITDDNVIPTAPLIPEAKKDDNITRNIYLTPNLISEFIHLAESNTKTNIETNGTLAGHLDGGKIIIDHIILCKQEGTANSCQTYDEHEMLEFIQSKNLVVFGWIHTHPTQSTFLSSVDLHTQLYYQSSLPESIAIVVAPKFTEVKFFSLTKYGINFLKDCKQQGFHDHASTQVLFEEAKHVFYDQNLFGSCKDFRTNK